jgi:Chaperone of endosialidase
MTMTTRPLASLLVLLPLALLAQPLHERTAVPLNNWPAPRHLQRSKVQTQQRFVTPQFQLPGGITNDVLVFVPIAPCRLADTRPSQPYPALGTTPLASNTPRTLPIAGACKLPTEGIAEAYSLDVTVVPVSPTAGGYLLVYPNPELPVPVNAVASLTWNPDASYQSNAVITAASSDGSVNVVVNSATDVVVDINGYYAVPTDANEDTALGRYALESDTTGSENTAFGYRALSANTSGSYNVAVGFQAMNENTGTSNTAIGIGALADASGSNNIAVGAGAGDNLAAGNYNIAIGSFGLSSDDHTIRIGNPQTSTYIAGIVGTTLASASTVVINSFGQLGVQPMVVSSRRYKQDIQDMGDASNGLLRLRPVTFHYKKPDSDGTRPLDYGLIAEEVADVYPELVIRGSDGQIESVQYARLPAMLLNELQKEHRNAEQQARHAEEQDRRAQLQDQEIQKLEARLIALETQLTKATAKLTSGEALPSTATGR